MKTRPITKKIKLFILSLFLISISQTIYATDIVGYTLASNNLATSGIAVNYPALGRLINPVGITSSSYSSSNGWTCYAWNSVGSDSWATSVFSSAGYRYVSVVGQVKASLTGPRDFKAQYKIGAGSWTDVPDDPEYLDDNPILTLTASLADFKFRLPSTCNNRSDLYVRWVQNSAIAVNGGAISATNPTSNASIKGVSIQAEEFVAPSSQASNISIISVTPTTITIGCTPGGGDRRILIINNINSFTNPIDNTNPTAVSTYGGTGEQVVYNGTGTKIVITVPSSTDQYWLRYYDYSTMDELTRFNVNTSDGNPKLCALENIHSPLYTNVRLTRATLGATITTPTTGTIVERGFFWSYSSTVDETSQILPQANSSGGSYTLPITDLNRGTTVYFKGYVTNESGTIMTSQSNFSNIPIFTSAGNWEDNTKWNVQEVPGENGDPTYGSWEDSPVINANCIVNTTHSVTDLLINSAKNLSINPNGFMTVWGTLTNNAGTTGLTIKSIDNASTNSPNGSLIFYNGPETPVQATVEMFSKAKWDLAQQSGSKYSWQFFGIPVKTLVVSPTFSGSYVRKWDETGPTDVDLWIMQGASSTLFSGTGYELCQSANKKYSIKGELTNEDFSRTMPYTSSSVYPGQNIFGNPYTAAIDIEQIQFGTNTEQTIYLYNTGTYNEWSSNSGETLPGNSAGQYTATTPQSAGGLGIPSQIPSMQAFLLKAQNAEGSVYIPYWSSIKNVDKQRVKAAQAEANSEKVITRIDITNPHYSDRVWIFTDHSCTTNFDNGWDAKKLLSPSDVPQLYAVENDGKYQIDAVNNINNTYLELQAGIEKDFKLTFTHQNTDITYSKIYLIDLLENKTIDITANGSEYDFTAEPGTIDKRFKIITNTTETISHITSDLIKLQNSTETSTINVQNFTNSTGKLIIYNASGVIVKNVTISSNSKSNISTSDFASGIYFVYLVVDNFITNQKLYIR